MMNWQRRDNTKLEREKKNIYIYKISLRKSEEYSHFSFLFPIFLYILKAQKFMFLRPLPIMNQMFDFGKSLKLSST